MCVIIHWRQRCGAALLNVPCLFFSNHLSQVSSHCVSPPAPCTQLPLTVAFLPASAKKFSSSHGLWDSSSSLLAQSRRQSCIFLSVTRSRPPSSHRQMGHWSLRTPLLLAIEIDPALLIIVTRAVLSPPIKPGVVHSSSSHSPWGSPHSFL